MLKQESILPVKAGMETPMEMEIDITLCSHAVVLSRQAYFIVLNKVGHSLSSAFWGQTAWLNLSAWLALQAVQNRVASENLF